MSADTNAVSLKFGVVVFPGSNCEQDVVHALHLLGHEANYVWHQDTELACYDAIVLPGGFSYGDYLRCGAVARFSPVMESVIAYANAGRPVIGICNGFQILTEAKLLAGALLQNRNLKFICEPASLIVEKSVCKWLDPKLAGSVLEVPINHNEGNYFCDAKTLAELKENGQIVLRYRQAANGSLDNIAGICNRGGNVFGLMPHPERVCDFATGSTDGRAFFSYIFRYILEIASNTKNNLNKNGSLNSDDLNSDDNNIIGNVEVAQ
ncbi:MAG: phosphoribosylformylglycinamidine synthase subunit PurQ [Coriobacteriales bacterium]|jgi:phosphoribosylformylglycinamidine synthase|nr:phosphoribosylformylglycinamidine synthase subunit PurQ [Coriobacteriales bacterium]